LVGVDEMTIWKGLREGGLKYWVWGRCVTSMYKRYDRALHGVPDLVVGFRYIRGTVDLHVNGLYRALDMKRSLPIMLQLNSITRTWSN
jgi:hypothetical protein